MHVSFQGVTWELDKGTADTIFHYAAILEDVPELNTMIDGLVIKDFLSAAKSYFWCFIILWPILQLGRLYSIIGFAALAYIVPTLVVERINRQGTVGKHTKQMKNALIIYFSFHRLNVFMTAGKAFMLVTTIVIVLVAFPSWLIPVIFALMMSSICIQTEIYVNQMSVK